MSDWINFVKQFSNTYNIPYKEALSEARPYYDEYKRNNMHRNRNGTVARMYGGDKTNDSDHFYRMAEDILGYGGEQAQKGALAALLSGLDANINIK
jgi:hypothetical protein